MVPEEELGDDKYGVPVHVISKNANQEIRISINEFRGVSFIDIRLFFKTEDGFAPTKKGVTIPTSLYPELAQGILILGQTLGMDADSLQQQ